MALSISHPVSTRDTNIIPIALALAFGMILASRIDTGCDTERAISYYVYHILKHEKVLFCIMNLQSRDKYHLNGYDQRVMISVTVNRRTVNAMIKRKRTKVQVMIQKTPHIKLIKRRYKIQCALRVFAITLIRYGQNRKIGTPNN